MIAIVAKVTRHTALDATWYTQGGKFLRPFATQSVRGRNTHPAGHLFLLLQSLILKTFIKCGPPVGQDNALHVPEVCLGDVFYEKRHWEIYHNHKHGYFLFLLKERRRSKLAAERIVAPQLSARSALVLFNPFAVHHGSGKQRLRQVQGGRPTNCRNDGRNSLSHLSNDSICITILVCQMAWFPSPPPAHSSMHQFWGFCWPTWANFGGRREGKPLLHKWKSLSRVSAHGTC